MTNERKTQWHPAFCSAIKLELRDDAEYLEYTNEYNLNTKPLQMDLMIEKKEKNIEIKNEIGKIFRKHNIIEYKSPDDFMNENTYLKVVAYACLYKSYEEHVDDIQLEEITITLVREKKPQKLFRWFEKNGYQVNEVYKGIYYVEGGNLFLTQILVSSQLSEESQKWLTLLSSNLKKKDAERIVSQIDELTENSEKMYGDSVLQVAVKENRKLFEQLKEDGKMCEALRELMEPEIAEAKQKAMQEGMAQGMAQGIAQGVRDTVAKFFYAGNSVADISRILQIPLKEVEAMVK